MNKLVGVAAAAATALTLGLAYSTTASAAVTLDAGEESCDLYTTGCLFTHGGGGEFDDGDLIRAAYNAEHNATPAPEDLPELTFLGKSDEGGIVFVNNGNEFVFTDLPFEVSFFSIKAGPDKILLFGLNPATDSFTALNTRITNGRNPRGISHVTFFGTDGGGGNEIPEPSTWALMIMGFGSAGAMLRRRKAVVA